MNCLLWPCITDGYPVFSVLQNLRGDKVCCTALVQLEHGANIAYYTRVGLVLGKGASRLLMCYLSYTRPYTSGLPAHRFP